MANVEVITYRGIRFRRYPDADGWAERAYYTPGIADRQAGVGRLHEEVWKAHHGPIPAGHHVHHVDRDRLNNAIDNLVCLTAAQHAAEHAGDVSAAKSTPEHLAHLAAIRPQAAAWHGSAEGLAWHAEHGRRTWQSRQALRLTCERCGQAYESRGAGEKRYCSANCRTQARKASGVDNVERTCAVCGDPFTVNRYSTGTTCSRSCRMVFSHRNRKIGPSP